LFERACELGTRFFVGAELVGLERSPAGAVTGARVRRAGGESVIVTDAVVLAPGGLNRELDELARIIDAGSLGEHLPVAPFLRAGSAMSAAAAVGAALEPPGGDRVLPIDPRSDQTMPIVGTWFCGILVGLDGRRFLDEAELAFELQMDAVARAVLARGGLAFALTDATARAAMPMSAALQHTDQPVITADSVAELAERLGMESAVLEVTVAEYNAAVVRAPADGPARIVAGTAGLWPPKSTWAWPLTAPPFEALPVGVQLASLHEGLHVDETMRVVDTDDRIIPGLYAAGDVVSSASSGGRPEDLSARDAITSGRLAGMAAATVMQK
jgi:tricarballylate dehydrogenase